MRSEGAGTASGKPRGGSAPRKPVTLGLERLLREKPAFLRNARIGVVSNQASVDHDLNHAADLLASAFKVTTLFGPQHGIRGDLQDNMIETPHTVDPDTGLPVFSLYSETREPTEEMLQNVDAIVFDMQDVGCRIYTFIYTLANCMRVAARLGKKVVVCDRPNPINGMDVAGSVLDPQFASFVGQYPIPVRHGMTVAELGKLFNEEFGIGCDLELVPMEGWARQDWLDETDTPWVMPSPNIPDLSSATVFPGTVYLEGTQVSEGRGTTRPFELVGAPYIDARAFAARLQAYKFPGVHFRATGFQPTFQKHAGKTCGGVQIHVLDRNVFEPVSAGIAIVKEAHDMYPGQFAWKQPPYEYVFDKNPFDVIAGTDVLRKQIEAGKSVDDIRASWKGELEQFHQTRKKYLLY